MDPADYLREHGGPDLGGDSDSGGLAVRRARVAEATQGDLVAGGWTVSEAAPLLGMSLAQVADLVREGHIYSYTVDGVERLARWQIGEGGGLLPGLPTVIAAIPDDVHALAVESFMTTPRPDFDGQAPVAWLTRSGGPDVVAAWLEGMGRA